MGPYSTPATAAAIGRRWKGHVMSWYASRDLAVASLTGMWKNWPPIVSSLTCKIGRFHMFLFGKKTDWTNQWNIYRLWIDSNHGDTLHYSKVCFQKFSHELKTDVGIFNLTSQTQNPKKCQRSHHEHLRLQPWQAHHPVWRNPRKLCIFRPGIRMGNITTRKHISPLAQFSVESKRFHIGKKIRNAWQNTSGFHETEIGPLKLTWNMWASHRVHAWQGLRGGGVIHKKSEKETFRFRTFFLLYTTSYSIY